jgi:hypothetical protein
MDTLDGVPMMPVVTKRAVSTEPKRVEPLVKMQSEFNAINNALTDNPTKSGIELAHARFTSLERNLELALSMYSTNDSGGDVIPTLDIDDGYIDPAIANLFQLRCKEVIAQNIDHESDAETRSILISLQRQVTEATIEVLDALGIMEEMREYRSRIMAEMSNESHLSDGSLLGFVNDCRRFLERVKECRILPEEFKIGATLMRVQLRQLEDTCGIIS